ncbi:transposase [Acinetobacter larvae]|uniref:Transposase n=1 Tax=Acinetobacter larvae TaxID=1789224 RepID=A0A1B2M324_9GAMM|nr:transposase [Acinetobacter larvae]AOA59598.1 transposase [Acinetobacter larvae]
MKILSEWHLATANNGKQINVKVVPLKRKQNSMQGGTWVEVGKMIQLESGLEIDFNLDGKSFYAAYNELYRLD